MCPHKSADKHEDKNGDADEEAKIENQKGTADAGHIHFCVRLIGVNLLPDVSVSRACLRAKAAESCSAFSPFTNSDFAEGHKNMSLACRPPVGALLLEQQRRKCRH
jgi:hypothetical protein